MAKKAKKNNPKACSKGEDKVMQLLRMGMIPHETQKTFETCRFPDTGALARFDFFVNGRYLIEYDGEQHFKYSKRGWNNEKNFRKTKWHDAYKTCWCRENGIPLIRIPYTKLETLCLLDLLLETSEFRVV